MAIGIGEWTGLARRIEEGQEEFIGRLDRIIELLQAIAQADGPAPDSVAVLKQA